MRLHLGNAYVANKYICVLIDLFGIDLCYNFAQRVKFIETQPLQPKNARSMLQF